MHTKLSAAPDPKNIREAEEALGISVRELADVYVLLSVKGLGPQKFKAIHKHGAMPGEIIVNPSALPIPGGTGEKLRDAICQIPEKTKAECVQRAEKQLVVAFRNGGKILTYNSKCYPRRLFESSYPVPILYIKGSADVLQNSKSVACVGSRGIREPYSELQRQFATFAAGKEYNIVSGFALGADTIAHKAAVENNGATVGVMPSGLDRPFPPENKQFWTIVSNYSKGVFVSEFPFGTGANSLNLKKRNKMIVAFAQCVLIAQSAEDGGAMNAYRFAREQKKPVATFVSDGAPDTSGNKFIQNEKMDEDCIFPLNPNDTAFLAWLARRSSLI